MKHEKCKYKMLEYVLSLPDNFVKNRQYPIVIFLHGAGTRGNDINVLLKNPYFSCAYASEYPFVSFAPQCYADSWFDIFEQLQDFIGFAVNHEYTNKDKAYMIGASMGGYAVWQMAMTMPDKFAAIVPICGGGMYWNADRLKGIKIWAFHGSEDACVFPEESRKMIDAVNASGGDARLTVCEGVGHNSWTAEYRDKSLFEWLFSQSREAHTNYVNKFNNHEKFG